MLRDLERTVRTIESGGAEIASEAFGEPGDPAVLLVMGAMASMLWWPDDFCRRLAAAGRRVIRYDNRDTGRSTRYPPGAPGYGIGDMAGDAIRVLDGWSVPAAHVVGMSLGEIAQRVALGAPERVLSLTAISTSPVGVEGLPGPNPAYLEHGARAEGIDWSDRGQVIDYMVEDARMLAGTAFAHDPAAARAFVAEDFDRAGNFASATNHFMLGDGPPAPGIDGLRAPLLVIHGTADPIFAPEHGAALARAVAGASLVTLDGGGHELHPGHWPVIVEAIVAHSAGQVVARS
jgi:pimeloyl-ACP methyl ester carboxylesterase